MNAAHHIALLALLALASSVAFAFDPSPLQDFCVAINDNQTTSGVFVNGKFCKDPKLVNADDFFFSGLKEGDTSGSLGYISTLVDVSRISGLNTLGISLSRLDFAPKGLNPPHLHPRATEILIVLEGTLQVGFISSNPENRLFTKVLNKGDVFVFPISHIHFLLNVGDTKAVAISGLSSQNPGLISIAKSVFGSNPPIAPEILTKAFQVNGKIINYLEKQF